MLLFAFLRGGFSIHCHSADEEEEGVPAPSKPPESFRTCFVCKKFVDPSNGHWCQLSIPLTNIVVGSEHQNQGFFSVRSSVTSHF